MIGLHKIEFYEVEVEIIQMIDKDGKQYQGWMALAISGCALVVVFYLIAHPVSWLKHLNKGKGQEQLIAARKVVCQSLYSVSKGYFLWALLILFMGYQATMLAVVDRSIGLRLQDFPKIDIVIFFVILYLVTAYFRSSNQKKPT